MSTAPDESCRLGVEAGEDVYVWSCAGGEHVVIVQHSSALFGRRRAVREASACGATTPSEPTLRAEMARGCDTPPTWQVRP
jgi:hypothetical protein